MADQKPSVDLSPEGRALELASEHWKGPRHLDAMELWFSWNWYETGPKTPPHLAALKRAIAKFEGR